MAESVKITHGFARQLRSRLVRWVSSPWFVLLLGLLTTLGAWRLTADEVRASAWLRFDNAAGDVEHAIQDRLKLYENSLRGAQGLFVVHGIVTRDEWHNYVESLNLQARYPGIQGIGFALRVSAGEKRAHIEKMRAEGFSTFTIRPEGARPEYYPVTYLEPFQGRNLPAFGYDMFSEPVRREAMERARDAAGPAISGQVRLIQESAKDLQSGFLMYVPVYQKGRRVDTAEARRAALLGFVYSPFRMNDLMQGIFGLQQPDLGMKIFDGAVAASASLMYGNPSAPAAQGHVPMFVEDRIVHVGGRPWTLRFEALPAFDQANSRNELLVLGAGIIISLLLFAITRSFAETRSRALVLAKRMTEELRESKEQFRSVAETANDAIISADEHGRIVYFNQAAERILGYSAEEALGWPLTFLMPQRFQAPHRAGFQRFITTGQSRIIGKTIEVAARKKNGGEIPVEISVAQWSTPTGKFFTAILRDVSVRKETEEALRNANEGLELRVQERTAELGAAFQELRKRELRFRALIDNSADAIALFDAEGKILYGSSATTRLLGYQLEEFTGRSAFDFIHPDDHELVRQRLGVCLQNAGGTAWVRARVRHKAGAWRIIEGVFTNLLGNPAVGAIVNNYRDVTERARLERRFQQVVELAPSAMVMVNADGRIVMVNAQAEILFGYGREDLIGQPVELLVPERSRAAHPTFRRGFLGEPSARMGVGRELYARRKDGSEFPVEIGLSPIETEEGLMVLSAIVDITERNRAAESRFRLAEIVDSAEDAIISKTLDGVIVSWNPGAERMFGYAADEVIGQNIALLIPPELQDEERKLLDKISRGERIKYYESRRRRKDGSLFDVSLTVSPIRDDRGNVTGASKIAHDITERKQREERIRAALREKDLLLGEIHHRVKNNLQLIDSLLDLQALRVRDEEVKATLRDSQNRVRSMALIHQTLYQSKDFAKVDFKHFLDTLLPMLMQSYAVDPDRVLLEIDAHRVQLPISSAIPCGLAVNELVTNALKHAFPNGQCGTVRVELTHESPDEVVLVVSNDGLPMAEDLDFSKMSTLGMQLVHLVAEQLQGHLEIERLPRTRFMMRFPYQGV